MPGASKFLLPTKTEKRKGTASIDTLTREMMREVADRLGIKYKSSTKIDKLKNLINTAIITDANAKDVFVDYLKEVLNRPARDDDGPAEVVPPIKKDVPSGETSAKGKEPIEEEPVVKRSTKKDLSSKEMKAKIFEEDEVDPFGFGKSKLTLEPTPLPTSLLQVETPVMKLDDIPELTPPTPSDTSETDDGPLDTLTGAKLNHGTITQTTKVKTYGGSKTPINTLYHRQWRNRLAQFNRRNLYYPYQYTPKAFGKSHLMLNRFAHYD